MRPLHLCALLVGVAAAGAACGGSGGSGPSNTAPTAAFTPSCTNLACTFTNASSDPEGDALTYQWNFGEAASGANNTSTVQSPSHTYAAAGAYHVTLTATDANGAASPAADSVLTVSAANQPPIAVFTVSCNGEDCTFTDASSDPEGGALTYDWDFGDGSAHATDQNPTHTYSATGVTPFTVALTVTDAQGATGTATQDITVTAPAQCNTGTTCTFDVTSKAIITVTLISHDCEFTGNRLAITAPIQQTIFLNGCTAPLNQPVTLGGPNTDMSFNAGTQIQGQFTQGNGKPTDPPRGAPAIQLTGTFPDWTLNIEDGGNPTGPGEPDFNDLVVTVHAQTVP
jgi:PKD repeat protein